MTKPKKLKAKISIFHPILSIREKAYNNIIPFGYNAPVERIKNSIIGNMLESYDSRSRISEDTLETLDDLWGTYLSIPEDRRHKIDPSNRLIRNSDGTYLLNNLDPIIDDLASAVGSYHSYLKYPGGERNLMFFRGLENGESDLGMNNQLLGTYTYTRGKDNQGEYVSYRDDWNINPWKNTTNLYGQERKGLNKYLNKVLGNVEDVSMGIGTSVPIRGKVYLSDIYGVPRDNSHWLSEVVVTPDKKADGGPISKWEDLSMKERHLMIRVGVANGLRDILSIKELYNSFAEGGPKRLLPNTSPTALESTMLEDSSARRIARDNAINHEYDIPYIPERVMDIMGHNVSTNALDSIAKYAGITNTPLDEAIALSFESGYGRLPYFNYGLPEFSDRAIGNMNYHKNYGTIPSHLFVRDYEYTKGGYNNGLPYTDKAPLEHAMEFYQSGRYNPKLRVKEDGKILNHTLKVQSEAKKLAKDKNYLTWKELYGNKEYSGEALRLRDKVKAHNKYKEEHPIKAFVKDLFDIEYANGGPLNKPFSYSPIPQVRY